MKKSVEKTNNKKFIKKIEANKLKVGVYFSQEQIMLNDMFGQNQDNKVLFGNSEDCLPRLNGALISGNGLIKSGDTGETASMFGI